MLSKYIRKNDVLPTVQSATINDQRLKVNAHTLYCGKFPELKPQTLILSTQTLSNLRFQVQAFCQPKVFLGAGGIGRL